MFNLGEIWERGVLWGVDKLIEKERAPQKGAFLRGVLHLSSNAVSGVMVNNYVSNCVNN